MALGPGFKDQEVWPSTFQYFYKAFYSYSVFRTNLRVWGHFHVADWIWGHSNDTWWYYMINNLNLHKGSLENWHSIAHLQLFHHQLSTYTETHCHLLRSQAKCDYRGAGPKYYRSYVSNLRAGGTSLPSLCSSRLFSFYSYLNVWPAYCYHSCSEPCCQSHKHHCSTFDIFVLLH